TAKTQNCRNRKHQFCLQGITPEMEFLTPQIVPYEKTKTANGNQSHQHHIDQPIICILNKRCIRAVIHPHQVKSCVTKGRNRMENSIPNPASKAHLRNKTQHKQYGSKPLKKQGPDYNLFC